MSEEKHCYFHNLFGRESMVAEMEGIRCVHCKKLLMEAEIQLGRIKKRCPKCGAWNLFEWSDRKDAPTDGGNIGSADQIERVLLQ